jgi:SulP family sulfate permease
MGIGVKSIGQKGFRDHLSASIVAGSVCGLLTIIISISNAAFIFSGPMQAYLPLGIGLALFAALMLAGVTALMSSIPGVVATSQEVPVVTLSVIATSIVATMGGVASDIEILVTLLCVIALSSMVTGLSFLVMGVLRLGRFIRFVPFPVIGGFLAGTGWLIVQGSLGVILNQPVTIDTLPVLLEPSAIAKWLPALVFAGVIWVLATRVQSPLALPTAVIAAVGLFHICVWVLDIPVGTLLDAGWLIGGSMSGDLWPPIEIADLAKVDWVTVAKQAPKIASMVIISAMALLLSASGLELAFRTDIDFDRELRTAGIANLCSGVGGGIAGYHELSLSVLSIKLNAPYRLVGVVVAAICGIALLLGGMLLEHLPKPVFGSLLLWIGVSLLHEWLVEIRPKISRSDYLVILVILVVIAAFGFLEGVLIGIIAGMILFVVDYSRVDIIKAVLSGRDYHSNVDRSIELRRTLQEHGDAIVVLRLQGFVFFGTAHRLNARVRALLVNPERPPIRFLLLDFHGVSGLDSSAVIGFNKLAQMAEAQGFKIVLARVPERTGRLLAKGGFGSSEGQTIRAFNDLDQALEWCEAELLGEVAPGVEAVERDEITCQLLRALKDQEAVKIMVEYLDRLVYEPNDYLIRQGEPSDDVYFVESGRVSIQLESQATGRIRLRSMGPGAIVGEIAFYLHEPRTASVIADSRSVAWRLTIESLGQMQEHAPNVAALFHEHVVGVLAERLAETNRLVRSLME